MKKICLVFLVCTMFALSACTDSKTSAGKIAPSPTFSSVVNTPEVRVTPESQQSQETSAPKPTPEVTEKPVPKPILTPSPTPKPVEKGISEKLYQYVSIEKNGQSIAKKIYAAQRDFHNTCVMIVSEALRNVGCNIPHSTLNTDDLVSELTERGFKRNYNLRELKPGAIAFTTDENGGKGFSTHAYIFLGWKSDGVAWIFDNQIYDYSSHYHKRLIILHYLNDDKNKVKEATLFFMYK